MLVSNNLRFALTFALFAGLAVFAWKSGRKVYAEGPQLAIEQADGAVVLIWRHEIEAPMARRFADAFAQFKDETAHFAIDLDSPGGSITEGRLVIAEIERMKATHVIETHVGAGANCLSMCVPIFLAGQQRTAAATAQFMFHEPSTRDLFTDERVRKPGFEQEMTSERFFERYFVRSAMNPDWREKLRASWKGRDLWFTAEELAGQGSGVVERVE